MVVSYGNFGQKSIRSFPAELGPRSWSHRRRRLLHNQKQIIDSGREKWAFRCFVDSVAAAAAAAALLLTAGK